MTGLPERMQAWRLIGDGAPVQLQEVPVPRPGADEVLLEVTAVGLCHSDVYLLDATSIRSFEPPFTLGHEIAGTVVAAPGDGSLHGQDVLVHGVWGCGTCHRCRTGRGNYCTGRGQAIGGGIGKDGGLAPYVVVPRGSIVDASGLAPTTAAPLTDGGLTSYHAVSMIRDRLPGADARVVVIGVGGLGHLAVQLLRATTTARVLATDTHPPALDLATRCGAHLVGTPAELRAEVDPLGGADAVLDFVGVDATIALGAELLGPGGDLVVVGGGGGTASFDKGALPQGIRISAPFWGAVAELGAVVDLARAGHLVPEVEVIGFDEVPAAYDRLRAGGVLGRLVVDPRHTGRGSGSSVTQPGQGGR